MMAIPWSAEMKMRLVMNPDGTVETQSAERIFLSPLCVSAVNELRIIPVENLVIYCQ